MMVYCRECGIGINTDKEEYEMIDPISSETEPMYYCMECWEHN